VNRESRQYRMVVRRLKAGRLRHFVLQDLTRKGISESLAERIVTAAEQELGKSRGGARTPATQVPELDDNDSPAGNSEQPVTFALLPEPRPLSFENFSPDRMTTLFATGLINPFGPTLNAVVLDGPWEVGTERRILHLMLNPFSQEYSEVGVAKIRSDSIQADELACLSGLELGSCPTLLLPGARLRTEETCASFGRLLSKFADGSEVLDKVRRHPGDPWSRVQEDMDGLGALIRAHLSSEGGGHPETRRLNPEEGRELATGLLRPENQRQELLAFVEAWKGSIAVQAGNPSAPDAMSIIGFMIIYESLGATGRFPSLKEAYAGS